MNVKNRFIFILVLVLVSVLIALPAEYKTSLSTYMPSGLKFITDSKIGKGLDLAGGVGLDFKVDTSKIPDEKIQQILKGIVSVVNGRVNALGVSEPDIVLTQFGNEHHIKVTLAGVTDIQEAKKKIGKTIQLEFKVPKTAPDAGEKDLIKKQASDALTAAKKSPEKFDFLATEWKSQNDGKVTSGEKSQYIDEVPEEYRGDVAKVTDKGLIDTVKEISISSLNDGTLSSEEGFVVMNVKKVAADLRSFPKNAEDFQKVAKEVSDSKDVSLSMIKSSDDSAKTDYIKTALDTLSKDQVSDVIDAQSGFVILKADEKIANDDEQVQASHILLKTATEKPLESINADMSADAKKKAEEANKKITTENEQIKKKNDEVKAKIEQLAKEIGTDKNKFVEYAQKYSEDTTKEKGGDLGFFGRGMMVKPFEDAAFSQDVGTISAPVQSQFGYHLILTTAKKPKGQTWIKLEQMLFCYQGAKDQACASSTQTKDAAKAKADAALKRVREEKKYTYAYALFSTVPDQWKPAEVNGKQLTGEYFKKAEVVFSGLFPIVSIEFNDEGGKLFEELTGKYQGQQMAIFVGGGKTPISAPRINEKISGGKAVIQGTFSVKEANDLARDLNTGAIPAPILLSGEEVVGPELGQIALDQSVKAGLIGLVILSLFMIAYYRFKGVIAVAALLVYALLYIVFIKILPGFNLTLAGAAAIVLSIGMAVDGNVLIFERFKEEMALHPSIEGNVVKACARAWPAIRDTHVSSIITGFLLFFIGADMVKGFAVFLIVGILMSLFTSVYVTRIFLLLTARSSMGQKLLAPKN